MRQESTGLLGAASAYDEVPYASYPYAQSHPDRLATIATLFGMSPPPIDKCRVLELGCASGGNLIPMAYGLRDSEFLGIDISAHHIAEGQALCKTLALTNIELRRFDILDLPTSLGSFDYIIAHGLYSWVPPAVQEKILKICRTHLVSQGVAYISYNTYPGWHFRGMIRDMMLYHTRQFSTPKERAAQGRALLDFLAKSVPTKDSAYGTMLQAELDLLGQLSDNYILHDHLEQANEPLYFHEFAERAGAAGLRYLGEADFNVMVTDALPQDIARTLQHISKDILRTEQYMDFVRNRTFRQTLLCHEDIVLRRALAPDVLKGLAVASSARPVQELAAIDSEESVSFRRHLNDSMSA
jgi:SAM-dependent methyltransferase